MQWRDELDHDPVPWLLRTDEGPLHYQIGSDLLDQSDLDAHRFWSHPEVLRWTKRQQPDGSWHYQGNRSGEALNQNYEYLETYRTMGFLIEMFRLDREHSAVAKGIEYLLSLQTEEGDIRGIYGKQCSPNYTAAVAELAIKAGYEKDRRIEKVFEWLISERQSDGGWALGLRTRGNLSFREAMVSDPIPLDRTRPSSHAITGVVLRAFAAHPWYKRSEEAVRAAELLRSQFFKRDRYRDRATPDYWTKFTFPFWFTDIVSSLDSISSMGMPADDENVQKAIAWMRSRQRPDGGFDLNLLVAHGNDVKRWVVFSFCRSLKRFYG